MAEVLELFREECELSIDCGELLLPNHSVLLDDLCRLGDRFNLPLNDQMLMFVHILRKLMMESALVGKCDIGSFTRATGVEGTPIVLLVGRRQGMGYSLIH